VAALPNELENLSWADVEQRLENDRRLAILIGATEQHGYLSLATDTLLTLEIARAATRAEGVLLAPPFSYGNSLWAQAYPGTLSLSPATLEAVVHDLTISAQATGFRSLFFFSGHSGNRFVRWSLQKLIVELEGLECDFFEWYAEPAIRELAQSIRPDGMRHANWTENHPVTRLPHMTMPGDPQELPQLERGLYLHPPREIRELAPTGMCGEIWEIEDTEYAPLFERAVELARERLRGLPR
jgi:creatinine amidohydrolase